MLSPWRRGAEHVLGFKGPARMTVAIDRTKGPIHIYIYIYIYTYLARKPQLSLFPIFSIDIIALCFFSVAFLFLFNC